MGPSREKSLQGVAGVALGLKCGAGYKSLGKRREQWSKHVPWGHLEKRHRGGVRETVIMERMVSGLAWDLVTHLSPP